MYGTMEELLFHACLLYMDLVELAAVWWAAVMGSPMMVWGQSYMKILCLHQIISSYFRYRDWKPA